MAVPFASCTASSQGAAVLVKLGSEARLDDTQMVDCRAVAAGLNDEVEGDHLDGVTIREVRQND